MSGSVTPIRRRGPVMTAAASGDRRQLLEALRDLISAELDEGVPARELASLSKRLVDISNELESLDDCDDISRAAATPDEDWVAESGPVNSD